MKIRATRTLIIFTLSKQQKAGEYVSAQVVEQKCVIAAISIDNSTFQATDLTVYTMRPKSGSALIVDSENTRI